MKSDAWGWREEATLCALNLAMIPWWNVRDFWQTLRCLRAASKSWAQGKPAGFRIDDGRVQVPLSEWLDIPLRLDG